MLVAGDMLGVGLSTDGGQTWQVLAIDQVEAAIDLPLDGVQGGAAALVEVQASDGVRTATRTYSVAAP